MTRAQLELALHDWTHKVLNTFEVAKNADFSNSFIQPLVETEDMMDEIDVVINRAFNEKEK